MDCPFCNSEKTGAMIIVENEYAKAFPTNIPIVPGHTLVVPKRHVESVVELERTELLAIFELVSILQKGMIRTFGAHGFNGAFNQGEKAGQAVPHFHLHLVPRKPGDTGIVDYDPRKFLYRPGSREISPNEELLAVAEQIRKAL